MALDQDTALRARPGSDQGDEVGCVDGTPAVLRGFDELERHRQPRRPGARARGDLGALPAGRESQLGPVGGLERLRCGSDVVLVLGVQISARAFFAPGCADLGSAVRTLAVLWNQHRPSLACGNTSLRALQKPSAPSPTASTGAR